MGSCLVVSPATTVSGVMSNLGRIQYRIRYDDGTQKLHVTVVKCEGLPKNPGSVGVKVLQSNPVVPFPNPVPVGEKVPGQLLVLHLSFHLDKISARILTKLLRLPPGVCVVPRLRVVHVGEEATKVKVFKANLREILPIGVPM